MNFAMKTPITYYGGKQQLVKELLPLIPKHRLYVEAFAGGGALFFAKPPSPSEILNDTNGEIENFYRTTKEQFEQLKNKIDGTLHSRNTHTQALYIYRHPLAFDNVTRAWAFWVVTNQGFSGKIGSWAIAKDNKTATTLFNKKEQFTTALAERLNYVQLESNDALKIIHRCDTPDTFFYLDPPYFNSDCGHYKGYTKEDYIRLLEQLSKLKGKFLLSSYPSELLTTYIKKYGWHYKEKTKKINVNHKSEKQKTEVMVYNYDALEEKITSADYRIILKKEITLFPELENPTPCMQELFEKSKHRIANYFTTTRNKVPP
jgi:DNA adenine methylase